MSTCVAKSLFLVPCKGSLLSITGTFGRVLECWDRKHRTYVAIKIVRNVKKYRDAAMIEASVVSAHMYTAACSRHRVQPTQLDPVVHGIQTQNTKHTALSNHTALLEGDHLTLLLLLLQLEVLNTLERNDPNSRWHCVHLQEWFDYRSHVCMVRALATLL